MDTKNEEVAKEGNSQKTPISPRINRRVFLRSMLGAGASFLAKKTEVTAASGKSGIDSLWHPRQLRQDAMESNTEPTVEAGDPLSPATIDFVETYGHNIPLTREDLVALNNNKYGQQIEQKENTYYATCLVSDSLYRSFKPSQIHGTLQRYMMSHFESIDAVGTFFPSRSQGAQSQLAQLIVLKDEVVASGDLGLPRSVLNTPTFTVDVSQFTYSDALLTLDPYLQTPLLAAPDAVPFDKKLVRDFAAELLHLPNCSKLDLNNEITDTALSDVPKSWRVYQVSKRSDITDPFFTTQDDLTFGPYSKLLLDQRLTENSVHGINTKFEGDEIFPARFPDKIELSFSNTFAGGSFELYRVDAGVHNSSEPQLIKISEMILDNSGSCIVSRNAFLANSDAAVSHARESTYFVKVTMPSGKTSFRWLDIRDIASSGLPIVDGSIPKLEMRLANESITPEAFDWSIQYNRRTLAQILDDRISELMGSGEVVEEQPRNLEQILTSQETDGLVTVGSENPLPTSQFNVLTERLNKAEFSLENDTYYSTMYITKENYDQFHNSHNESFQSFLKRHEVTMNNLLVKQAAAIGQEEIKFVIRRLIIAEDQSGFPNRYVPNLNDSDGAWTFYREQALYNPEDSGYFDKESGVDYGLLHEWGHAVFHLPDEYTLDVARNNYIDQVIPYIPERWREYMSSWRNDTGGTLMSSVGHTFGEHAYYRLLNRIKDGIVHEKAKTASDLFVFPKDIPQFVTLQFDGMPEGEGITMCQTYAADMTDPNPYNWKKGLRQIVNGSLGVGGAITLSRAELEHTTDDQPYISADKASYFIEVTSRAGEKHFRWIDIKDLNLPYFRGMKDHAVLQTKIASPNDTPDKFDWTIHNS